MSEFPRIQQQGIYIACAYKAIGLYSIPLLTIVTIISMTNVFTAGTFSGWPYVSSIWAFIFALAIDVNIVRLFVEAEVDKSKGAFWIGLGLCVVTGAALFLEGLQQSIGVSWREQSIQYAVSGLVGCRVFLVIILMAREGGKLGVTLKAVPSTSQETSTVHEETLEESQESLEESEPEQPSQELTVISLDGGMKREKVKAVLRDKPEASLTEIEERAGVSQGYASKIRGKLLTEIQSEKHQLNGVH